MWAHTMAKFYIDYLKSFLKKSSASVGKVVIFIRRGNKLFDSSHCSLFCGNLIRRTRLD